MITFTDEQWGKICNGYEGKSRFDGNAKKNLDVYRGDIFSERYLPRYSTREHEQDYKDRLKRSENNFFNFVRKILTLYSNSIFRSTEPTRTSDNKDIVAFWENADGNQTPIGKFTKDRVFLLQQITGGCLVVVDKPRMAESGPGRITRRQQEQLGLFPYAYVLPFTKLHNFEVDEFGRYKWVMLDHGKDKDQKQLYKLWDTGDWWIVDGKQNRVDGGSHNLGQVPVIPSIAIGDPKYNFQVPISPFDDMVRITLKIFETLSMLDQMIISHIWLKLAMPQSMFEVLKSGGSNHNVLVFPDNFGGERAYYIETPGTEIGTLITLIFEHYPRLLLELATIRSKTDKPREESGEAKFIDSSDELANLTDKAEAMERAEQQITDLYAAWEEITGHQTTISYSKNFDVKSLNETIEEMVQIFKQDLQAPTFAKEITKRVAKKMLGNIDEATWRDITAEIDASIDPALDLDDADKLIQWGVINLPKLVMRYNPDITTEEEAKAFLQANIEILRAVPVMESDTGGDE